MSSDSVKDLELKNVYTGPADVHVMHPSPLNTTKPDAGFGGLYFSWQLTTGIPAILSILTLLFQNLLGLWIFTDVRLLETGSLSQLNQEGFHVTFYNGMLKPEGGQSRGLCQRREIRYFISYFY